MTNDVPVEDLQPRTWLDSFPWLLGVADFEADDWWNETIEDAAPGVRVERLGRISELATSRLSLWTIGEVFPGLPPDLDLRGLDLPTRATNALLRAGCRRGSDVASLALYSIMDWSQIGIGTIDAILRALAGASTALSTPRMSPTPSEVRELVATPAAPPVPQWLATMMDDMTQVATWYVTIGLPARNILGEPLGPETPAEIVKARRRLEELRADDVLMGLELEMDAATLLDDALSALDPRASEVLAGRLFADVPRTLDDLGVEFGVTRERVRQIEGKARAAMLAYVSDGSPLTLVADATRALIGTIRPLDDLIRALPALAEEVRSAGQPVWRVLDRLDDAYEVEDDWCVVPTMRAAKEWTRTQLQELADDYGVVRLGDIDLVRTSDPSKKAQLTAEWLLHCGYVVEEHSVLTRTGSVGDYGAAVLSIAGSPLSTQEIVDRFIVERSAGSLRNAMSNDERFERVDRDKWALVEWGLEAYSGIRTVIRERVTQHGGSIRLDTLIEEITGRYTVAANSVVSYASSPPFACKDGTVRLAAGAIEFRKTPERTRHLYRRRDNWAYRVRINPDHLRGSGSAAPVAVASILGLKHGETRHLDSSLGTQAISFTGTQPSFGSIRRLLLAGDVAADTEGFLVLFDNGRFAFEPVRDMSGNPLFDALSLIGAPVTACAEEARSSLASAVGLPDHSPVSSMIGRYRDRGDGAVADLLVAARTFLESAAAPAPNSEKTAVDDILELL